MNQSPLGCHFFCPKEPSCPILLPWMVCEGGDGGGAYTDALGVIVSRMSQATCSWFQPDVLWPHPTPSGIPIKPPGESNQEAASFDLRTLSSTSSFSVSASSPQGHAGTPSPCCIQGTAARSTNSTHPRHLCLPKLQFHLCHTTGSPSSPLATLGKQDVSANVLRIPTRPWEQLSLTHPALNLTPGRVMWKSKDVQSAHPPFL